MLKYLYHFLTREVHMEFLTITFNNVRQVLTSSHSSIQEINLRLTEYNCLEFLFYNEYVWFALALYLYFKGGCTSILTICFSLFLFWLICQIIISGFSIEFLFLVILIVFVYKNIVFRKRNDKNA